MKITFLDLAKKIIKEQNRPLSATEIWEIAKTQSYDKDTETISKKPWLTLYSQLLRDTRDNPTSEFRLVSSAPKRYIISSISDKMNIEKIDIIDEEDEEINHTKMDYDEKKLHPFMVYFGFNHFNAYLKTICSSKAKKKKPKGADKWTYPDLVGCYFPFKDWEKEVFELSSSLKKSNIKLYSFELKKKLTFGNYRKAFFQAVSNSSWSNEGYLAAEEIDNELLNELERLSASFGIGIIQLDIEDPDATEIITLAKSKEELDWETINILAQKNPDFKKFLVNILDDFKINKVNKYNYDEIMDHNKLIESLKNI